MQFFLYKLTSKEKPSMNTGVYTYYKTIEMVLLGGLY